MKNRFPALAALVLLTASSVSAQIIYVDATDGALGNTAIAPSAGGGVFTPVGVDAVDNMWRLRTSLGLNSLGVPTGLSDSTVYEASGNNGGENSPRLVTTISGLAFNTYDTYLFFWGDQNSSPWRIRGSLNDDAGNLFIGGGAPSGTPVPVDTLVRDGALRVLWRASLGQVTGSSITVFIDDGPGANGNERSWYDGIGYAAVPEPTSAAVLGLGALISTFIARRKKS